MRIVEAIENLRVLHVTPFGRMSGAMRSALALAGEQAKHRPTYALILEEGPWAEQARAMGVVVETAYPDDRRPRTKGGRWWHFTSRLLRMAKQHEVDLIHCHSVQLNRYAWPVARLLRVPLVTHQRDMYQRDWFHFGMGGADRIITVSHCVAKSLPEQFQARTMAVHNGARLPAEEELGERTWEPVRFGMPARCRPFKGHEVLIDAAAQLMEKHDFQVRVCGLENEGPGKDFAAHLRRKVAELGEPKAARIQLEGLIQHIDHFYREVDVVVVPSLFVEPLGRVGLEAMSWGKAVIASNIGGLPEMIDPGRTGLLFEPGDVDGLAEAMERLLLDAALREKLGQAAREKVAARLTAEQYAQGVEATYRTLFDAQDQLSGARRGEGA